MSAAMRRAFNAPKEMHGDSVPGVGERVGTALMAPSAERGVYAASWGVICAAEPKERDGQMSAEDSWPKYVVLVRGLPYLKWWSRREDAEEYLAIQKQEGCVKEFAEGEQPICPGCDRRGLLFAARGRLTCPDCGKVWFA